MSEHPIEKARKMIQDKFYDDTKHFYAKWETTAKVEDEMCMTGVDIGLETALSYIDECLKGIPLVAPRIDKDKPFACNNCACWDLGYCNAHEYMSVDNQILEKSKRPDWCPAFIVEMDGDKE